MKKEELIKKLEQVELPQVELESHRSRLKMALLDSDTFNKRQESTFMEAVRSRGNNVLEAISRGITTPRPVWKTALASAFVLVLIAGAFFASPAAGPLRSALFPSGTTTYSGPQLTDSQKEKAMDILLANPQVQELLSSGALIEVVLPIEVVMERTNSETGAVETITETWAQAWIKTPTGKQWGAQVDLIRGKVMALKE